MICNHHLYLVPKQLCNPQMQLILKGVSFPSLEDCGGVFLNKEVLKGIISRMLAARICSISKGS